MKYNGRWESKKTLCSTSTLTPFAADLEVSHSVYFLGQLQSAMLLFKAQKTNQAHLQVFFLFFF